MVLTNDGGEIYAKRPRTTLENSTSSPDESSASSKINKNIWTRREIIDPE
jgi:hypothetical protein